jgi:hypothetical protein
VLTWGMRRIIDAFGDLGGPYLFVIGGTRRRSRTSVDRMMRVLCQTSRRTRLGVSDMFFFRVSLVATSVIPLGWLSTGQ